MPCDDVYKSTHYVCVAVTYYMNQEAIIWVQTISHKLKLTNLYVPSLWQFTSNYQILAHVHMCTCIHARTWCITFAQHCRSQSDGNTRKYVAIYITKNINVGLDGMAEEEAVGKAGCTSMQQKFACRQSSLLNTSKHYIKIV